MYCVRIGNLSHSEYLIGVIGSKIAKKKRESTNPIAYFVDRLAHTETPSNEIHLSTKRFFFNFHIN